MTFDEFATITSKTLDAYATISAMPADRIALWREDFRTIASSLYLALTVPPLPDHSFVPTLADEAARNSFTKTPADKASFKFDADHNVEPFRTIAARLASNYYDYEEPGSFIDNIAHALEDAHNLGYKRAQAEAQFNSGETS